MKLTLIERIHLRDLLPASGDYETMKIVSPLQDKLLPTQEESEKFEVKATPQGQSVHWEWNVDGRSYLADIEIDPIIQEIITTFLKDSNAMKTLTISLLSLYEKFIVE